MILTARFVDMAKFTVLTLLSLLRICTESVIPICRYKIIFTSEFGTAIT